MKKKENKKGKLTESLHLTVEMTKMLNYNFNPENFAQTDKKKSLPKPQSGCK